jgi:hypothetical protein
VNSVDTAREEAVMNVHARRLIVTAAVVAAGCAQSSDIPGYPLYSGQALPRDQIARVFGSIATIDGQDVSGLGAAFELRPGCHVVRTLNEAVDSTNYVTSVGQTGARTFAFPMKPGYSYFLRREIAGEINSSLGSLVPVVIAEERNALGVKEQVLRPLPPGTTRSPC